MEKIMSKTGNATSERQLTDAELDEVSGGYWGWEWVETAGSFYNDHIRSTGTLKALSRCAV
jgi:hypothetical protein